MKFKIRDVHMKEATQTRNTFYFSFIKIHPTAVDQNENALAK
jgi:hypothetical protein